MKYIIKYNGEQFAEVDINYKDLPQYKKELLKNLPKATIERKVAYKKPQ